jgi:hypothetical protein
MGGDDIFPRHRDARPNIPEGFIAAFGILTNFFADGGFATLVEH